MSTTLRRRAVGGGGGGGDDDDVVTTLPPPEQVAVFNGGVVCLLTLVLIVALLACTAGALTYWRVTSLESKLDSILPSDARDLAAEQQTLGMQAVRGAAEAFRKRQQQQP